MKIGNKSHTFYQFISFISYRLRIVPNGFSETIPMEKRPIEGERMVNRQGEPEKSRLCLPQEIERSVSPISQGRLTHPLKRVGDRF
jgi:hypothetical protein